MKTRIVLYLASLALWGFLRNALFVPAFVVAQNVSAVATLNGGDTAFVSQQALSAGAGLPVSFAVFVILTAAFWFTPISNALKSENV
jgi:hypothetical protein